MNSEKSKLAQKVFFVLSLNALIAAGLSLAGPIGLSFQTWLGYFLLGGGLSGLSYLAWRAIGVEKPGKPLFWVFIIALLFRLGLSVFWYRALPVFGYDTDMQQAGYVMSDAFVRDTAAWHFAQSEASLFSAFRDVSHTDQYGGLLFLSGLVYRYLGGTVHQPLQMAAVSAVVSSLSVLLVWALAKRMFGLPVANFAAWAMAFYPDAALLGSSQMREAYSMTLVLAIFYSFIYYLDSRRKRSAKAFWLGILFIGLSYALSGPLGMAIVLLMALIWVTRHPPAFLDNLKRGYKLALLLIIFLGLGYFFVTQFSTIFGVQYEALLVIRASGKIQALFERIPEAFHMPFLVGYGVFRPLLPAAIASQGIPIWTGIAIWRALGWTALLFQLLYASYLVLKKRLWLNIQGVLMFFVWFGVLVASFRGAGDLWDNPRYRTAFAGLQILMAAWSIIEQKKQADRVFRWSLALLISVNLWFIVWYVNRNVIYFGFMLDNLPEVLGLGLLSGGLYIAWDWYKEKKRKHS